MALQLREGTDFFENSIASPDALQIGQANWCIFRRRADESIVVRYGRAFGKIDVMDLPARRSSAERRYQIGISIARPRPAPDLSNGFFVNSDENDVAADGLCVDVVADDAEAVFRIFAGPDQAEQDAEHQRPAENPLRMLGFPLTVLSAQPSHGAGGSLPAQAF